MREIWIGCEHLPFSLAARLEHCTWGRFMPFTTWAKKQTVGENRRERAGAVPAGCPVSRRFCETRDSTPSSLQGFVDSPHAFPYPETKERAMNIEIRNAALQAR